MFWKKGSHVDHDAAWKQQNREQTDNPLYRFINLDKGGILGDTYEEYGPEACEHVIATEIEPYLYNQGKGKLLRKIDYLRWRNKLDAKMSGTSLVDTRPDEQVLAEYREDDFITYDDHEACWDINLRGGVGETALHLAVLHDTPMYTDIAKMLLRLYPKTALDIYEGVEYYGETALHLAIVYGDLDMVRLLVESGAEVNRRATGRFFLPEDQKKGKTKYTSYEGYAYYGEYPLAFAACFGHEEIYDFLIDHGADPNMQDSFGNTVLHMLVISNQIGMYGYAVKHHCKRAIMEKENFQCLTALTLASKLGRNEIFKEIIELQSIEIWRYSNVTCSTYPLAPLDTIGLEGKINWSSALIYITDGETDEHLEMLEGGVVKQLLDEKWKTYARRRFVERLVVALMHLLCLSTAIYTREDVVLIGPTEPRDIVRYVAEIIVCINCLVNLIMQLEEVRSQGVMGFLKNQASAPAKFIFNISCVLILVCVPCRFLAAAEVEIVFLALAAPCAWAFLLFFARGVLLWGPFVIMIYKMCVTDILRFFIIFIVFMLQFSLGSYLSGAFITIFYQMLRGDLYRFAIIYCIFLLGFSPAFFFLFKDVNSVTVTSFQGPVDTIMQLFQMTLGEFRYEEFDKTRIPDLTKTVFAVFAMLVPILLLNMLIAMMGNTYQLIISRSEKEWKRQWAKIIIVLERTFSHKQLLGFQEEYAVKLMIPGSNKEEPGLMVIKTSLKTKARQRKGAITNWKKLVSEVKALIKEVKKEGRDPEHIDLTSQDVAQKLQKRRSNLHVKAADTGIASSDNLLSAMNQLAWERDLDLEKKILPVDEEAELLDVEEAPPRRAMFLSKKAGKNTPDRHTPPAIVTNKNAINSNKAAKEGSEPRILANGDKPLNPQLLEMQMQGLQMQDRHSATYSPGFLRGSRVSPEYIEGKPPKDKRKASGGRRGLLPGTNSRPPSARSSSGGSKDSKDSAFSEGRRRTNLAISGSRSSLNSASSLTSLLNASQDKAKDHKDDDTDF